MIPEDKMLTDTDLTLNDISKHRRPLFGVAIIWICLLHWSDLASMPDTMYAALSVGSVGVDIFIFLSGFGLFYSFSKDGRVLPFYAKRILRIIPSYLMALVVLTAVLLVNGSFDPVNLLLRLFLLDFWVDGDSVYWYISFIMALYLIFPLFFTCFDTVKKKTVLFVLVTVICFSSHFIPGLETTKYDMAYDRLPAFILGSLAAQLDLEDRDKKIFLKKKYDLMVIALLVVVFIFSVIYVEYYYQDPYNFKYYTNILLGLLLIAVNIMIFKIDRARPVIVAFSFLGDISLELYLMHCLVMTVMYLYINPSNWVINILLFMTPSIISAYLLKQVSVKITDKLRRKIPCYNSDHK